MNKYRNSNPKIRRDFDANYLGLILVFVFAIVTFIIFCFGFMSGSFVRAKDNKSVITANSIQTSTVPYDDVTGEVPDESEAVDDESRIVSGNDSNLDKSDTVSDGVEKTEPQVSASTVAPKIYTIIWGDTLSELSESFDVPMARLIMINTIQNPDLIYAGDSLIVPVS